MKLTAFELVYHFDLFQLERKWNASWFVAAFVCYTHVYLVFVASVLSGLAGVLPVSEKKFLQGKAGALFIASYLFAWASESLTQLVSIGRMIS